MTQGRRPMSNKTRKIIQKEVKKGQKILEASGEPILSDELDVSKAMKKYPKVKKSLVDSTLKGMEVKKTKAHAKHSKRTTPGEVEERGSSPAHIHTENNRWEKIVDTQSKGKGKALNAKLLKRNSKKGK